MSRRRAFELPADLSREDAFSLAAFLVKHVAALERGGFLPSPGLTAIAESVTARAMPGQRPPISAEVRDIGQPVLMTYAEAGDLLAYSRRTVSRLVAAGAFAPVGSGSGARLRRTDVEAYAARKQAS